MLSSLTDVEFQLFKKYIKEKCGIDLSDDKAYLIETRLSKLLADSGMESFNALYNLLSSNNDSYITEKVIDAITTNETLWFRDQTPWLIVAELLMPTWLEQLRSGKKRKIRFWSAAASTGQEAYSTAMWIDHYLQQHAIKDVGLHQFEILATDISQTVLEIARKGRYDAISIIRGLEPVFKERYFQKEGITWVLNDRIKAMVQFEHFNLQNSFLFLGKFDVVFCRYVLIYFSEAFRVEIFKKLIACLEPPGMLFLGSSELYSSLEPFFEMKQHSKGTYYLGRGQMQHEIAYG